MGKSKSILNKIAIVWRFIALVLLFLGIIIMSIGVLFKMFFYVLIGSPKTAANQWDSFRYDSEI